MREGSMMNLGDRLINSGYRHSDHTVFILNKNGMIEDCSESINRTFFFTRDQVRWKHLSNIFPDLSNYALYEDGHINSRANLLCRIGWPFKARTGIKEEIYCLLFISQAHFNNQDYLRVIAKKNREK